MWRKPKYVTLRNKKDADEFLWYEIEQGNEFVKSLFIPEFLAEQTVKVEFTLGKRQRKRLIVSYKDPITWKISFYPIHPSSINFKYFWDAQLDATDPI